MTDFRKRIADSSILVVGDVMLDRYWFGEVDRISPEAPVPVVHVQREEYRLGGAANVAANAAALGASVTLMSVVGEDEAGEKLASVIHRSGIKGILKKDDQLSTTVKLRVSGRSQQLLRIDFENRPGNEVLERMTGDFCAVVDQYDAVLLSDYGKGGLGHVSTMIDAARAAGKPVLVDPKGRDYAPYRGATVVTPNRGELALVTGAWSSEAELERLSRTLRDELDLGALLVTRSEEGMSLFDDAGHFRVGADAREVFDVTGAGDTVIATLATLVAAGMPLRDAVPIANRAGGIVVAKFGTSVVGYDDLFGA
ncbi:D-glycero-beta-D-manno-heptose-7-phosphate kinase [Sphingomonas hengshuiensis]|uniref:D-glycero-beta-D-manno-heptose-7-phosphate kinase n=1 Tax=Sphingomonas hengshuiensis TaxID=1609977 RepID=UPI00069672F5|nr:D-glycero-beta-D-manno-heptose-7-phosphate kinase [Sphingomonas hengshuiensis]